MLQTPSIYIRSGITRTRKVSMSPTPKTFIMIIRLLLGDNLIYNRNDDIGQVFEKGPPCFFVAMFMVL
jgi:hypothetical protein